MIPSRPQRADRRLDDPEGAHGRPIGAGLVEVVEILAGRRDDGQGPRDGLPAARSSGGVPRHEAEEHEADGDADAPDIAPPGGEARARAPTSTNHSARCSSVIARAPSEAPPGPVDRADGDGIPLTLGTSGCRGT